MAGVSTTLLPELEPEGPAALALLRSQLAVTSSIASDATSTGDVLLELMANNVLSMV